MISALFAEEAAKNLSSGENERILIYSFSPLKILITYFF